MNERRDLPRLFVIDTKGKKRMWECYVIGDTIYRIYGLVDGKKIENERTFEGKSIGKKNEKSSSEQAWIEANKEWVKHLDKAYLPAKDDKTGLKMVKNILEEKSKTGGHNINSVAISGATDIKKTSRKKKDTCIVEKEDDSNEECESLSNGVIIPMKAHVWEVNEDGEVLDKVSKYFMKTTGKGKNMIKESTNFYAQPKLDGWRAIVKIQKNGKIIMTSNGGKQYPWFSSLRKLFKEWLNDINKDDLLDGLDGELYCGKINDENGIELDPLLRFSTICSICGILRSEPHKYEDQIQFHCFDLADNSGKLTQVERFDHLNNLFAKLPQSCVDRIIKVETLVVSDITQVTELHEHFEKMGYEGIILRTFGLQYKVGKRSQEIRKFKNFQDDEYEIVGCKVDKGVENEQFVWVLQTKEGETFNAKPLGSKHQKLKWYKNREKYIGLYMTVKFQELNENGIPRFAIGKHFRSGQGTD